MEKQNPPKKELLGGKKIAMKKKNYRLNCKATFQIYIKKLI